MIYLNKLNLKISLEANIDSEIPAEDKIVSKRKKTISNFVIERRKEG